MDSELIDEALETILGLIEMIADIREIILHLTRTIGDLNQHQNSPQ